MTFLRIVICSQSMLCRVSRLGGQRFPGGVLEQDKHYAALDGLRGFAAVSVVIFHIGHWLDMPSLAANAGLAVDVFFCLSGYVLSLAYGKRLGKTLSSFDFFVCG
jgi:peptidoglycan/LPS O-acetylase OafA/YrhL